MSGRIKHVAVVVVVTVTVATGLMLVAASAVADDLSWWTFRSRGTFPADLTAIASSPSGARILAVGTGGRGAWSHDGGATWGSVTLGTEADASGVAWQDEDRVWVSGTMPSGWSGTGVLLRSDDGGRQWTTAIAGYPTPLTSVAFSDATHGLVGMPADAVLATSDAGETWAPVDYPGMALASIELVDAQLGHAAGTGFAFTLARTTDGGATWTQVYDCPNGTITGISFPDDQTGFLVSPVSVARSVDAGATWLPLATLSATWIEDVAFATPGTGWIAGIRQDGTDNRGLVLVSTDSGATWSDTGLDEPDRVSALAVTQAGSLIAAGSGGTLLRTDDGGASWTDKSRSSAAHLRDLLMESPTSGWAVGPPGAVHHTADGGHTWSTTGGLGTNTLESVVRAATDTLYACGSYAFIASEDDGASWQMRYTYLDCHTLEFTDALNGLAGTRYGVFWTDDGGASWTMADNGGTGTGGVFDIVLLSGTHGFAAAGIGTILETSDGGRAWTVAHSEPPGFNSYLYGIAFSSATSGYAVGMDGVILTTSDGGASWVHRSSGVISDLRDVHPLSATEALVVGDGGMVLLTSDAGVTWERVHSGTTTDLWAIEVPVGGVPLVAGDWGTVLEPATPLFADDFESGDTGAWSG